MIGKSCRGIVIVSGEISGKQPDFELITTDSRKLFVVAKSTLSNKSGRERVLRAIAEKETEFGTSFATQFSQVIELARRNMKQRQPNKQNDRD